MRVIVAGAAKAYDLETEKQVTDRKRLESLHGLLYDQDTVAQYIVGPLAELGIEGGVVKLDCPAGGTLRVVTEYSVPRKLKPRELKDLISQTLGQWSDGIGEGEFMHREKVGMSVDLAAGSAEEVTVEQFDDGLAPARLNPLFKIVKDNAIEKLKAKLATKADVNVRNKEGMALLSVACLCGHCDIVMLLIASGADVRATEKDQSTALKYLAMSNRGEASTEKVIAAASALVMKGAEVEARDAEGRTPLMWAASREKTELVKYLQDQGADINAKDAEGCTPLMYCQNVAAAKALLELGADPSIPNEEGMDAAEHAELNSHWRASMKLAALYRQAMDTLRWRRPGRAAVGRRRGAPAAPQSRLSFEPRLSRSDAMEPTAMQARQQAYLEILHWGLLAIREAAYVGKTRLCEIEADHIHNLPSLFNEQNEKRHHYYIGSERQYYLEQLERHGEHEFRENQTRRYENPWKVLMQVAIPELEAENAAQRAELGQRGE